MSISSMASAVETKSPTTTANVFKPGKYSTKLESVKDTSTGSSSSSVPPPPPKPLLMAFPCEAGEFPVLIFLHGSYLFNSFYSQLIQHVASHGFIVIAPQLYCITCLDANGEIQSTAAITNWLPEGLQPLLPPYVRPNLTKLALSGHSRGGKVSFALALSKSLTKLIFSALIGVDPVDGLCNKVQTPPPVLTYVPHSFDLEMPVMVIGTSLGEVQRNPLFPPCAPKGVNHKEFFNECRKPACYFVAEDCGHLDVLDNETKGFRGKLSYCLCKNGKAREPMRTFVGGIMVAFMRGYLEGDFSLMMAIRNGDMTLPVELKTSEFLE